MSSAQGPAGTATRFAGVIGDPVAHSLSPALHNAGYAALGLDWRFGAFRVDPRDVPAVLAGARALGFAGLAVTMPLKAAVARHADQRSARVERLESANTVVFRAGVAVAESTDGAGLLADLAAGVGFDPAGRACAVVGAGGAARDVVLALAEAGAREVLVVGRNRARAASAAALAGGVGRTGVADELGAAELVVNATPLGMSRATEDREAATVLGARLGDGQLAVDLVYAPQTTPFLEAARAAGAQVRNGLGMLVHQAALQFALFTGQAAPLEALWAAVGPSGR